MNRFTKNRGAEWSKHPSNQPPASENKDNTKKGVGLSDQRVKEIQPELWDQCCLVGSCLPKEGGCVRPQKRERTSPEKKKNICRDTKKRRYGGSKTSDSMEVLAQAVYQERELVT